MSNISQIVSQNMCCGCGACASICPKSCITFIEGKYVNYPIVEPEKCIDCDLCMKVCPGNKNIKRFIENKKVNIQDDIKALKVSYSTDENLRFKSASGGVISQMLKSLMEVNEIDGAIVVTQNKNNILMNSIEIINNIGDIERSQGSRYSPASNCIILKELIESNKYNKVAFVGKPCDIEALSSFERLNKKLKDKIVVKIAIMCHHAPTRKGLKHLLNSKNIKVDDVKSIKFRGNGWPGNFEVITSEGDTITTPYFDVWNNYLSKDKHIKCMYCENPFPLEADLIVGDPWGDEYENDKKGQSLLIIRSGLAIDITTDLEKRGVIISKDVSYSDVERYQKNLLIRNNQFNLNSLLFKKVHGYKVTLRDYRNVYKEHPKNILKYFKRIKKYKDDYSNWKYE